MALTNILRSSSACVIGCRSQLYRRGLATAANRGHIIIPTSISSFRRFSSPSKKPSNFKDCSDDPMRQLHLNEQLVERIMAELNLMRGELQSIRDDKEFNSRKEGWQLIPRAKEVKVVKEKHPFIKEIESEMSKAEYSSQAQRLPNGFEIECDKPGEETITVKAKHKKETIKIKVSRPRNAFCSNYKMPITITVSSSAAGFFKITTRAAVFNKTTRVQIHCIATKNRYVVDRIRKPGVEGSNGVIFGELSENLRRELYKYLETRGVSFTTTNMLYEYMLTKINRENLKGLEPFVKIIDAA